VRSSAAAEAAIARASGSNCCAQIAQRQALRRAQEQPRAHVLLQQVDMAAHGRLRQTQRARRRRQAALFGHGDEAAPVVPLY
jgi:hypothetical protein